MDVNPEFRVLITGGDGFVAPFAAKAISSAVAGTRVLVTARRPVGPPIGCEFAELDVSDEPAVLQILKQFQPTHVLHLAGIASRAAAEANPAEAWDVNVIATLRLAQALKAMRTGATFIYVSSSQIYDGKASGLIDESHPIGPVGVYASTKAAADLAMGEMASENLRIVRFRPFNHTGPGQASTYVFGSFANQIAAIEAGLQPPVMKVGNLAVKRDFLDVRDVAEAYARAVDRSDALPQGNLFNLASGRPHEIGKMLETMLTHANAKIDVQVDPGLSRGHEPEILVGNGAMAEKALNWKPARPIENTMREMLEHARINCVKKPLD